jgi:uncharacterized protein YndB with AHSA1/START domain
MKSKIGVCFVAVVFASSALAAPPKADLHDMSFTDAEGHRVLREYVIADVPIKTVWKAFTTDEGFSRWAVPGGHVVPGNGGMMTWAIPGTTENVVNRIDVYLPQSLIVFHNEHAPAGGPMDPETFGKVRTMIALEPAGDGKTKITETVVGFGDDGKFDALYAHLHAGNAIYLAMLASSFHETDAEAAAAMQ